MHPAWSQPLERRPHDRWLVAGLVIFALTSVFVDRLAAMDVDFNGDGWWLGVLRWYGENYDPLFLANPQWLRVMSGISAFIFGPAYLVIAWATVRGENAIRTPALVLASTLLYSMVVHLWMELYGEYPVPNLPVLLAVYAPYAAMPFALFWRFRRRSPFSA